jgi:glycosyltransferase involved in cell wall biosynthesis
MKSPDRSTPLVSVVIPTYNRAALLREALASVRAQQFTGYEVIVVDDGSSDETASVAGSFGHGIRFFQQQNRGPGAARNLGIHQALGEFVAFLDSDDVWFPWTLNRFHQLVQRDSKPGFIIGTIASFSDLAGLSAVQETETTAREYPDYLSAAQTPGFELLTCSSVCVRRSELLRTDGFTRRNLNGEDSDLWLRLGVVSGFAVIQNPPICGYRRHPVSAVSNLKKTSSGMHHLIETELAGGYPGGRLRHQERIKIITRHVRTTSHWLARKRDWRDAASLYRKTFRWHCQLGRWKYLLGFWPSLLARTVSP